MSFLKVDQSDVGIFHLVNENIDVIIAVMIKDLALNGNCFANILGQGGMKSLISVVISSIHHLTKGM